MTKTLRRRHGRWIVLPVVALLAGGIDALGPFHQVPGMQPGAVTGTASLTAQADRFTISGRVAGPLTPTSTATVLLVVTNGSDVPLSITGLTVEVADITTSHGGEAACDPSQFAIRQFSGRYGFRVAAGTASSLAELGFPPARWPQVTMLDLPTNQDGCKNVVIRLRVSGTGLESTS
jgi:hypothetical protein